MDDGGADAEVEEGGAATALEDAGADAGLLEVLTYIKNRNISF